MFHLNSCQHKAPCFFSKNVPIRRTIIIKEKITKTKKLFNIILYFHENGKWIKRRISISKIINKTINKKNRMEKGFRLELKLSIPHSNALLDSREFFSNHKETTKITRTNTIVKPKAILIDNIKFMLLSYF